MSNNHFDCESVRRIVTDLSGGAFSEVSLRGMRLMVTLVFNFVFVLSPPVALGVQFQQKPAEAVENAADFLLDAQVQADQLEALKKEVMDLVPRVNAGGFQARRYSIYLPPPCLAPDHRVPDHRVQLHRWISCIVLCLWDQRS